MLSDLFNVSILDFFQKIFVKVPGTSSGARTFFSAAM